MKIRNFLHKGLQRLYSEGNAKGVSPDTVDKLRKMFAFLDTMADPDELRWLCCEISSEDREGDARPYSGSNAKQFVEELHRPNHVILC